MEVPTHSVKDVKASLSKRSPMPKKSVRKSMQSPYEAIRPFCTNVTEMEEIMRRLLAPAKRRSNRIPWSEFKKMTEEEKKQAKEEMKTKDVNKDKTKNLRAQLVCGMNELILAIEKHNLSSAVVSEDIVPAFMRNFIIDLATIHHVPIIIFPKLRKLTMDTLGFSCHCLGVKKNASCNENSHFYPMHTKIVEIAKEYDLPEKTNLCQCPRKESLDLNELLTASSSRKLQKLDTERLDGKNALEANSTWPCIHPNPKGYWKSRKEKLKNEECQQQASQSGKDSTLTCDELLEEGKKRSETLPASKRKGSKYHSFGKKPVAHPYLRTFLTYLHSIKTKKQKHAESVDRDNNGEHAKKSLDSGDDGKVSEVGSKEVQSPVVEESGDFKYAIRSGKKRKLSTFSPYKPLKLTDS